MPAAADQTAPATVLQFETPPPPPPSKRTAAGKFAEAIQKAREMLATPHDKPLCLLDFGVDRAPQASSTCRSLNAQVDDLTFTATYGKVYCDLKVEDPA